MTRRIAISIINYRTAELTLACVKSVLADLGGIDGHVVVVDNDSRDGSAETIAEWIAAHPDAPVELVRSSANSGFAGGHNQGIAACEAEFYLILNSDSVLRPGFFGTMLAAADAAPEAGLFAPRLEGEDGTPQVSCFRFPGPMSEFVRSACTGAVTRLLKRYEVALGTDPDPGEIGWASFACILLRRRMIEEIGPMDEGYFLYYEDAEYCLRAQRAGWRIAWVPEARAVHFRGGSGPVKSLQRENRRLPAYHYASRTRFLYQAHGWAGLLSANGLWYLGRGLAHLRRLAGQPVYRMPQAQVRDIWINVSSPLGPRHAPGE
jgi:N-acetylglucosaminyl-diphospho-decaprenol L-rhamnosyltransferase